MTKSLVQKNQLNQSTYEFLKFISERYAKFDYEKQKEFNTKFCLENLLHGFEVERYLKLKLDSYKKGVVDFINEDDDKLEFSCRTQHSSLHAIITSVYTEMFADFYSKHFPGQFGIESSGLNEYEKKLAVILTASHDIARQHGEPAHDEHNNAFYLALILKNKYNLDQAEAIKLASHVAKKDTPRNSSNSSKSIFSRLTQCADCVAIVRVVGGRRFNEEYLDARKDVNSIGCVNKKEAANTDLNSIIQFAKDFESGFDYNKSIQSFDEAINFINEKAKTIPNNKVFIDALQKISTKDIIQEESVAQDMESTKPSLAPEPSLPKSSPLKAQALELLNKTALKIDKKPLENIDEINSEIPEWREKAVNLHRDNNRKYVSGLYSDSSKIDDMLVNVIIKVVDETKTTENDDIKAKLKMAIDAILIAKQQGGVSSIKLNNQISSPWQKEFSRQFQIECKKCGILSGRGNSEVGLRTAYVPKEVFDKINDLSNSIVSGQIDSSKESVAQICNQFDVLQNQQQNNSSR